MGRQVNEATITTKNARSKLSVRKAPHWRAIDRGAHLGYRKGADGGTWVVRHRRPDGDYVTKAIGAADDALGANGTTILSYSQALATARDWFEEQAKPPPTPPYTVTAVITDYLDWYSRHRKALYEVSRRAKVDILPKLGDTPVDELDTKTIRRWHEKLASSAPRLRSAKTGPKRTREVPKDPEGRRKRKATANKTLTVLKAALNHAFREGHAASDEAWRRVKPFRNVDAARVRYLSTEEATRLVNACEPDFRELVKAALYTGCRYGELVAIEVGDFAPDNCTLLVRFTKNSKPRHVALTDEGCGFFARLTVGRLATDTMFLRSDGAAWGKSHQARPLRRACAAAGIDPPISFHILRHTFGSWLAMRGVALQVIADALGHADARTTHRHYTALAPSYVADIVRANLPDLGVHEADNVARLERR